MSVNPHKSTLFSVENQIHEEEVRFNEASRMNAGTEILRSIQQQIKKLKAQMSELLMQHSHNEFYNG